MYEVRDLSALTRNATIAVTVWLLSDLTLSIGNLIYPDWDVQGPMWVAVVGTLSFIMLLVSYIFVARWIYRACANAHARGAGLEITPRWAVGWYFVPIANLFKPFQSMKEIWFEADGDPDAKGRSAPAELIAWWTLWIVTNIISNVVFRLDMATSPDRALSAALSLVASMLSIPMSFLLILIMRKVNAGQQSGALERVFA